MALNDKTNNRISFTVSLLANTFIRRETLKPGTPSYIRCQNVISKQSAVLENCLSLLNRRASKASVSENNQVSEEVGIEFDIVVGNDEPEQGIELVGKPCGVLRRFDFELTDVSIAS